MRYMIFAGDKGGVRGGFNEYVAASANQAEAFKWLLDHPKYTWAQIADTRTNEIVYDSNKES